MYAEMKKFEDNVTDGYFKIEVKSYEDNQDITISSSGVSMDLCIQCFSRFIVDNIKTKEDVAGILAEIAINTMILQKEKQKNEEEEDDDE